MTVKYLTHLSKLLQEYSAVNPDRDSHRTVELHYTRVFVSIIFV
jgi:hypothetical protein